MKLNNYESVVIFLAALEDEQIEAAIQRVKETVLSHGGEFTAVEKWGRRRLAYPIQKSKSGYFLVMRYTAPSESIAKIERFFSLEETIIRYLTIKLDKKALAYYSKLDQKSKEESSNADDKDVITEETKEQNN